jgi:4-hydroxybenzoate polyprenyltransferase
MRAAGCAYNDIVDRDIDAKVARTAGRPIPSGQITVKQAWAFVIGCSLVSFLILVSLPPLAILLGVASLALVAAYPFMKRITWWPQAWLGLTFNWGALLGYAAAAGEISVPALLLYASGVAWTLGYDTIYAHQDRDDDAVIGVRSTARLFGAKTKPLLFLFFAGAVVLIGVAGILAGTRWIFALGLLAFAAHLAWQVRRLDIDNPALCLRLFRSNRDAGLILFAALVLDAALIPAR